MREPNQPIYPEELSRFLTAQAALLDAQPNGGTAHFSGFSNATPEQELWQRINDPERGLHIDDLAAYRHLQRGPVAKFFARLKFWL